MIAADKILADFGLKIFAWILLLLKGAESSFLMIDIVPVEHVPIDNIPETALVV